MNTIIKKLKGKTTPEVITKAWSTVRGLLAAMRLDNRSLIFVNGPLIIIKKNGKITIGDYTELWPRVKLSCFGRHNPAAITIGNHCSIGDRTEIHAGQQVAIGNNVIISWDCVIMDRDYHAPAGQPETCNPVTIEDNAWIGCRTIILKGVTIGQGAIIGAGSVVTKSIPPQTLAAGNPAKPIKKTKSWTPNN